MDMSSSMGTDSRLGRWTRWSGGVYMSDPTTWYAWAHRGHRLWAAMSVAFWVYVYKVHRCPRVSSHDWTTCPYAHNGERARRRDPRCFSYLAVSCAAYRESQHQHRTTGAAHAAACVHGLHCRYAHGVFELWLHPAKFRTVMCAAGLGCPRRVCFFAHFPAELRRGENDPVPVPPLVAGMPPPPTLSFPRSVVDIMMQAKPDDHEEGSIPGDYPHFDLIRDMLL